MTLMCVLVWLSPKRLSNAVTPLLKKPYAEQLQMKVADIRHALQEAAKEIQKENPVRVIRLFLGHVLMRQQAYNVRWFSIFVKCPGDKGNFILCSVCWRNISRSFLYVIGFCIVSVVVLATS